MSNSQLSKLKSRTKSAPKKTLKLLSNEIADSNEETNFAHKLLLTNTQVSRLCKALETNSSANIKLFKSFPALRGTSSIVKNARCVFSKENLLIWHDYADNLKPRIE